MSTPQSERIHIGFFGCRNAGKSSLANAITGQEMSLVSDVLGTTTDPVSKSMELLPLGPVLIVDTPGYDDDDAALGASRIERAHRVLAKTDIAVLVADATQGLGEVERELLDLFDELKIPHLVAFSKADLLDDEGNRAQPERLPSGALAPVYVSAKTGAGIQLLKDRLASIEIAESAPLVRDLLNPGDMVVLVTPIDESAPKGRLILPQVQTLRDILDAGAMSMVVKETELAGALASLAAPPAMVITDSQAFAEVAEIVPEDIPLTSFSILMARHKGFLEEAIEGVVALQSLGEGDSVLVAEGCTHDRKCNDIATVKIPRWLEKSTGT
ncbi:MAG: [Actinomycetaceae bacterium]|nr:[FeFe] hydrogenase H-cluster maturation GTPase HydF [Actinomycetaceae bacterium]